MLLNNFGFLVRQLLKNIIPVFYAHTAFNDLHLKVVDTAWKSEDLNPENSRSMNPNEVKDLNSEH